MYPWDERWWTSGSFHNVFQCSAAGCMTDLEKELNLISGKKSNHSWLLAENQRNVGRTVSSQTPLRNPALGEDYCYIHLHLNINFRTSIIFSTMSSCRKDFQSCGARNQANWRNISHKPQIQMRKICNEQNEHKENQQFYWDVNLAIRRSLSWPQRNPTQITLLNDRLKHHRKQNKPKRLRSDSIPSKFHVTL